MGSDEARDRQGPATRRNLLATASLGLTLRAMKSLKGFESSSATSTELLWESRRPGSDEAPGSFKQRSIRSNSSKRDYALDKEPLQTCQPAEGGRGERGSQA